MTATANDKAYDGTTAATVTLSDNRIAGDTLTATYTSATFSSATIANGKTVTVSGISISGPSAGNYTLSSTTATDTANITKAPLTVAGVTAANKVYNGSTTATLTTGSATLVGVVSGETVTLGGTATGVFSDKNAGTGKTVTISGFTIGGANSGNYTLTQPTATADITPATLTVSATGVNKTYDGTANTTVTLSDNHIGSDVVTTAYGSAAFSDKNVANGKPVTVTGVAITGGAAAANYTLASSTISTTANITVKTLTVTATVPDKVYDKTTAATVTFSDNRISGDVFTESYTSASFSSATAGNNKTVTISGISISGTDAANYTLSSTSASDTANITAKPLTVSGATASNKVYNGNTTATVSTGGASLVGVVSGDTVTLSGTAAGTFADKNIGTGKTVTFSGLTLSGTSAGNYSITQPTATADITAATLTVTATGVSRAYDATTNATVTLSDNHIGSDVVTTAYGSAAFADKNVANGKAVSVSGIAITGGSGAGNYILGNTNASTTANITKGTLTVTVTATNKAYDGTTAATVTLSDNRLGSDSLTVNYTSATFSSATVANGKTVTVSGISLSGTDSGNYSTSTSATTTANITKATLTVAATGINKVYDRTNSATVTLSDNRVSGDAVTLTYSASFADKNVADGKAVTVNNITISGGAQSGNYSLGNTNASTTANITAKTLTVTATAANKVYDGTPDTTATFTDNRITGDSLTVSYTSATFSSASVANNKTVTVSGISISGTDSGNYTVAGTATDTANITAKPLTVTGMTANDKVYNGSTSATGTTNSASLVGVIGGDTVNLSGSATGTFSDKNVGTNKTVTFTGLALGGASAGNYSLTQPTATASITVATLTVTASGSNRTYNGNTNATVTLSDNHFGSDAVTTAYTTAWFLDKIVGNSKPVTVLGISITGGSAAGNYVLGNTNASTTANITKASLTVSASAADKVYDGTNTATVTLSDNRISGDVLTITNSSATFSSASVGTFKLVTVSGISITGGTDAGNYSLSSSSAFNFANITSKALTVSGVTVSNKVYNGNTTATVSTNGATLVGVVTGDTVTLTGTAAGTFSSKTVGTNKTVTITGLSIGGASAGNYSFTQPSGTASITAAALTVNGITASSKVYNANTAAAINPTGATLVGIVSGDTVTLTGTATGAFSDKNVGSPKTVIISGLSLGGSGAGNYTLTAPTPTASITAAPITVTATGVNKPYDSTPAATVTLSATALGTDVVTPSYTTAAFADKNVANGKPISVTGISLGGTDGGNYTPNTTATAAANITAASLTVSATATNKVYDGTTTATVTLSDNHLGTDSLTLSYGSASFADHNVGNGLAVNVTGISIGGTDAGNYQLASTTATTVADITPASLTVTAQDATRASGQPNPAFSASYSGFVNSETFVSSGITGTPAFSTTATNTSPAGTYPIVPSLGTLAAANYGFTFANGTLTVTGAVNIAFFDDFTRATDPGDLAPWIQQSGVWTVTAGVMEGGPDANGHYGVVYYGTNWVDYSVEAQVQFPEGSYGGGIDGRLNPSTGARYAAWIYPEGSSGGSNMLKLIKFQNWSTFAYTNTDAAPMYQVSLPGVGTNAHNLKMAFHGNEITVSYDGTNMMTVTDIEVAPYKNGGIGLDMWTDQTPYAMAVDNVTVIQTLADQSIIFGALADNTYGVAPFDVSATASSGLPVTFSIVSGPATIASNTITITGAGLVTVRASQAGNFNYNAAANVDQSFTVNAVAITITADPQSKTYGDVDPTLTSQITSGSLVGGDALSGAITRVAGENAGSHAIQQGTLDAGTNYMLTFVPASLTINPKPITVTADPQSKTYGDVDPTLTSQITTGSLIGPDTLSGSIMRVAGENAGVYTIQQGTLDAGGNYALTFVPANLTIGQKAITVAADAKSKIYGDADPVLTSQITVGSLVSGDALSGSLARVAGENAGGYAIQQGSLSAGANYNMTFVPASLTIAPKALLAQADDKSRGYGDTNPVLTITYTGFITNESVANLAELPQASTMADTNSAIGTYEITLAGGSDTNYSLVLSNGTLTVTLAAITVTADAQSKVYGDADPSLTYQITSGALLNGDSLSGSMTRDAGETIGSYAIQQGTLAASTNYTLTFVGTNLAINPKAITVTADAQSKTYGDVDPTLTSQITSGALVGTDAMTGNITRDPGENAGVYAIQQGTLDAGTNYTLTFVPANLTINPRPITVTADPQSKTYGDVDPTLTSQITAGSLIGTDTLNGGITRVAGENVGAYAIQPGTLDAGGNYTLTFVPADLTINAKPITVTADAKGKVYGDADPALTSQITSGALVSGDALSGSVVRVAGENAGSYAIQQGSLSAGANYNMAFVPATMTIARRALLAQADDKSRGYGDTNPVLTITYTGFITNESVANLAELPQASTMAGTNSPIGAYDITLTDGSDTNYSLVLSNGTLTVTLAALTVTADTQTKVYGDADPSLTYQITSGALINGDTLTGDLTRDAGETTGNYAIQQGTLAAGTNYTLTFVPAHLTIGPRPITVSADARVKIYGNVEPALTSQITSGSLVSGDSLTGDLTRAAGENVGDYAIEQGTLDAGTNYTLTFVSANLHINPRPITVTADPQTKIYGDADPILTSQITSGTMLNTDSLAGTVSRVPGENAGSYAIEQGGLSAGPNYDLTFVPANLTIHQRDLTVAVDAQTKVYGEIDPALTSRITSGSLVSGDALSGSLTRVPGENAGLYTIQQGTLSAGANYNLTFMPADLTIARRTLLAQADDKSRGYGDTNPVLTITYTGFITNEGIANLAELPQPSTMADTNSPVGGYDITLTGGSDTNYSLVLSNGTLTITLAAITITADAQTKTYGDADPALTYQITSGTLLNGDSLTGSMTRSAGETIGSYAIQQGTLAANTNYTLTFAGTNLAINPKPITVTANAQSKTYGDTDPTLTSQVTSGSLVGTDSLTGSMTRIPGENVGAYAIEQGTLDAGTNYTLTFVSANLTIDQKAITISAYPKTKTYGAVDPSLTHGFSSGGLVGSDTLTGGLVRVPGETVGVYPIQQGTLTAGPNYNLTFVPANLTITPAGSTLTLGSSQNPSTMGSSVTFTATVAPVAPAPSTPTGTVQFFTNGVACGSAVTLSGGVAVMSSSEIPAGTNLVTAAYLGDLNFNTSSNGLSQVVNASVEEPGNVSMQNNGDGTITLSFTGTPGAQYVIKACGDLGSATWSNLSTNTAGLDGRCSFTESMTGHPARFYRPIKP